MSHFVELRRHLVRLSAAEARAWAGDRKLLRYAEGLRKRSGPVALLRLAEQLERLAEAPQDRAGEPFLRLSLGLQALELALLEAAPTGELIPFSFEAGLRNHECSGWERLELKQLLSGSPRRNAQPRLRALHGDVLRDIRAGFALPDALGDQVLGPIIAERMVQLDWPVGTLERNFGRAQAADVRRLQVISALEAPRAWRLAREALKRRPRAPLRARCFQVLTRDPEALPILLKGSKGTGPAAEAALTALAQRAEPEAMAALMVRIGADGQRAERPKPPVFSYRERSPVEWSWGAEEASQALAVCTQELASAPVSVGARLLRGAFTWMTQADLLSALEKGLSGAGAWPQADYVWALCACPPNRDNLSALCASGAVFDCGDFVLRRLGAMLSFAEPAQIVGLIEARRGTAGDEAWAEFYLWAALYLPSQQFYEAMAGPLKENTVLQRALIAYADQCRFGGPTGYWLDGREDWLSGALRKRMPKIQLDPRWWALACELELDVLIGALAPRGDPRASEALFSAAERAKGKLTPRAGDEAAIWVLRGIHWVDLPERFFYFMWWLNGRYGSGNVAVDEEIFRLFEARDIPGLDAHLEFGTRLYWESIPRRDSLAAVYHHGQAPTRGLFFIPTPRVKSASSGLDGMSCIVCYASGRADRARRELAFEFGATHCPTVPLDVARLSSDRAYAEGALSHTALMEPKFLVSLDVSAPELGALDIRAAAELLGGAGANGVVLEFGRLAALNEGSLQRMRDFVAQARGGLASGALIAVALSYEKDDKSDYGVAFAGGLAAAGASQLWLWPPGGLADLGVCKQLISASELPTCVGGALRSVADAERLRAATGAQGLLVDADGPDMLWLLWALRSARDSRLMIAGRGPEFDLVGFESPKARQRRPRPHPQAKAELVLRHFRRHLGLADTEAEAVRNFLPALRSYAGAEADAPERLQQLAKEGTAAAVLAAVRALWN